MFETEDIYLGAALQEAGLALASVTRAGSRAKFASKRINVFETQSAATTQDDCNSPRTRLQSASEARRAWR